MNLSGWSRFRRPSTSKSAGSASASASAIEPLVNELRAAIGHHKVRADGAERSLLSRDAVGVPRRRRRAGVLPRIRERCAADHAYRERHGRAVVPRGAGTGLAGGAIPLGAPIVVALTKMNRILEVDLDNGVAWVEPGVVNLDLTKHLRSAAAFTSRPIRRASRCARSAATWPTTRVARTASLYGVTSAPRAWRSRSCCPTGRSPCSAASTPEPRGLDLRGVFVGGEGTLGIATRIAVRISRTRRPCARCCCVRPDARRGRHRRAR